MLTNPSLMTAALTSTTPVFRARLSHKFIDHSILRKGSEEIAQQMIDRIPEGFSSHGTCSVVGELMVDLINKTRGREGLAIDYAHNTIPCLPTEG
jgi:hypothetical protein